MSRIIIFEGCDGSGKTTLALRAAKLLRARYMHFGPLGSVKKGLARLYLEGALPALLGYEDVVMDRSWLSELPYGVAFRDGVDRLGNEQRRMLERIFMRAQTTVVRCDPGWETVAENFTARKKGNDAAEYLDKLGQLAEVYRCYNVQLTSLPQAIYNYHKHENDVDLDWLLTGLPATFQHHTQSETAGNLAANTLIVGESYAPLTDVDSSYQKPFCAFSGAGCSRWLTSQLEMAGIGEERLLWCNADHLEVGLATMSKKPERVIALGVVAASKCRELGLSGVREVEHPQSHKRFKFNEPYPIQEALK